MQNSVGFHLKKFLTLLIFIVTSFVAVSAYAQSSEGGEGGGGAYVKLEPFTVNLVGLRQMIQITMTLKLAAPESSEKVKLYMPAIRHAVILLLSSKSAEQVETSEGKNILIKQIKSSANKAVGLSAKEGVADVLFESIIIQ